MKKLECGKHLPEMPMVVSYGMGVDSTGFIDGMAATGAVIVKKADYHH